MKLSKTIAAISTPIGEGGISVIKISGEDSFKITEKIFLKDKSGENKLNRITGLPHRPLRIYL